jgi:hypothetical protein
MVAAVRVPAKWKMLTGTGRRRERRLRAIRLEAACQGDLELAAAVVRMLKTAPERER